MVRVQARADGPVLLQPVAHGLNVAVPFEAPERCIVHEDLAVDAHDVEQADVRRAQRGPLFVGQVEFAQETFEIRIEPLPCVRVPVQLVEKLLDVVETHLPRLGTLWVS